MNDIRKRRGWFTVPRELLEDDYDAVKDILSDVIVVAADNNFITRDITYWAYSEHFEPIDEGVAVPEYVFAFTRKVIWKSHASNN